MYHTCMSKESARRIVRDARQGDSDERLAYALTELYTSRYVSADPEAAAEGVTGLELWETANGRVVAVCAVRSLTRLRRPYVFKKNQPQLTANMPVWLTWLAQQAPAL
jgi:hypothetical protein